MSEALKSEKKTTRVEMVEMQLKLAKISDEIEDKFARSLSEVMLELVGADPGVPTGLVVASSALAAVMRLMALSLCVMDQNEIMEAADGLIESLEADLMADLERLINNGMAKEIRASAVAQYAGAKAPATNAPAAEPPAEEAPTATREIWVRPVVSYAVEDRQWAPDSGSVVRHGEFDNAESANRAALRIARLTGAPCAPAPCLSIEWSRAPGVDQPVCWTISASNEPPGCEPEA